ncbi:non-ribosomal peptide synthetase [Gordonia soli]|uniref:Putative non-ribosomal peptide synthetase n=1 Tax=Gordonia soli NBRC 108243 TaxID=1223545 RepID=M0QCC9_9ACTN|nr:non-ribosomal peptide synthetase [Gordonia soli]GAC66273.1 putative non-ribosomal peptide synthetase [Gordonia soli NBRC 108243]
MTTHDAIQSMTEPDVALPMTAAQRGIFYAQQIDPDVPMSVAAFAEFSDAVDGDIMDRAVQVTSSEVESGQIRLVPTEDGEPLVQVDHSRDIILGHRDFSDHKDPRAAAVAWMDEHRSRPTDLFSDPLLETWLLHLGPQHVIWYCWGHHIAFDGYAAMFMMVRVAQHYTAMAAGEDSPGVQMASIAEIAEIDDTYRNSERFSTDRDYWAGRLTGDDAGPAGPELTSFSQRSDVAAPTASVRTATLRTDLVERIRTVAHDHHVRPASVITAAVGLYLARFNDRSEAMLSLPVAVRDRDILRTSAGLTSNVVPIRLAIDESADHPTTVGDLLEHANADIKGALKHQRYRHEDIVADVLASPSGRRGFFGPMVNVMLFFEHIDFGSLRAQLNVLSTGPVEDASVNVYDGFSGGMALDLEANPNVYRPWEIESHHRRLVDFVDRFVHADADLPVTELELITADELAAVDRSIHGDTVDLGGLTLPDLLDEAARRFPDESALVDAHGPTLAYADLQTRAEAGAQTLADLGVGPESVVGVMVPRSVDQVVALHAITRAGAAFVPIDPAEPAERLEHILTTAAPALVITGSDVDTDAVPATTLPVGELGAGQSASARSLRSRRPDDGARSLRSRRPDDGARSLRSRRPHPDQAAYVLFTSGSTGKPKGVMISHRAIVNRLRWMQAAYDLTPSDRVLQKTPSTFDVSVWEFYWPLITGAALVIPRPDGHRDPWYLREVIAEHGVTTTHFVPSMLATFADALRGDEQTRADLKTLSTIVTSGEALTPTTVGATAEVTSAPIHNLYGPTEAAIDVTFHNRCRADGTTVPIGRPVWNTTTHVLDHRLQPQPVGAIGELYLGGVQLARGYRNRSDLTAARFIADPTGAGGRLYRTGDLVRRRADGALEYLGRSDSQVKIRGQRVELGEIEAALAALDGVSSAGVVVRDDLVADSSAVVGYVSGTADLDDRRLREQLATVLPDHMIPTVIMVLDDLPTTANGKLDRRALPEPAIRRGETEMIRPEGDLEHLVAATIATVLGLDEVSMISGFFELGGNSLSATRIAARLSKATGHRIGIRTIFDGDHAAGIVAALRADGLDDADAPAAGTAAVEVTHVEIDGPVPLSPAQHRLWLTARLDPDEAGTYNIPFTVRLVGDLDTDALRAALNDLVGRHEPLRTRVQEIDGIPHQDVTDVRDDLIELPVLSEGPHQDVREFARTAFDLTADLPIRARLVRHADSDHSLTVVIHHIAADGWSLAPLAGDLATAYRARRDGAAPEWAPLPVGYRQVSADRHAWLDDESSSAADQLRFWADTLVGAPAEADLPYDRPRPLRSDLSGGTVHTSLPPALHRRLREIADRHDATMFMVLHAAVVALLRNLSRTDDITVGTPVSGRGDAELDSMVGMFVNTLVLRSAVDKSASFADLLADLRTADLDAFENADLPFDRLVTELNPVRSGNGHPFFGVSIAVEDTSAIELDFAGLSATASRVDTGQTKFDLQFTFTEHGERDPGRRGLGVEIAYASALFDRETVRGLASRLERVLDTVATDPDAVIGDVTILEAHERLDLVPAVGPGHRPVAHFTEMLSTAVASAPDRVAVTSGDRSLTYGELDRASNSLARLLIAEGAGPERYVAVSLPRGVDWMIALWAVAKAGSAWVPVDPEYPTQRIAFMVENSQANLLVTDHISRPDLDGIDTAPTVVELDSEDVLAARDAADGGPVTDADRRSPVEVDQPAYLIYTSGTTGTPKGVVVSHRGLADFAAAEVAQFGITSSSRTMHLASPSFDASVLELLMAVGAAATMYIVPAGIVGGRELSDLMAAQQVSHAFLTPSLLTTMRPEDLPDLETLVIGGEHPNPEAVRRWSADRRLFNAYGPTETTVVATVSEDIDPDDFVTIGRPIRGVAAMVLDERLQPVAPGAVGELYVCGPHLARGYHGIRNLTSKRFVANPYGEPGERMYRTGDLVRWRTDHTLEYRGRADHQAKIRGHRIELGEIDAALTSDDAVRDAVTVVVGEGDQARLVSYVTTEDVADIRTIRDRLADQLPRHMVPSTLIPLDEIPTTPIGKVDRRALPDPSEVDAEGALDVSGETAFVEPRGEVETRIAAAVADLLGIDVAGVGRDHDFFDLGGNSLLATQIVGHLEQIGGRRIPVRAIFDHPRIADLARLAAGSTGETANEAADGSADSIDVDERPLAQLQHDPDAPVAPGPAQQQLWFLNQLAGDGGADGAESADAGAYTIAFALDLHGELDVDALRGALRHAVDRHEPLRTVYPESDGRPRIRIRTTDEVAPELEVETIAAADWTAESEKLARAPFDLTVDAPIRARLHRIIDDAGTSENDEQVDGPPRHKLTIVIHHIAADGWSMAPLSRDIAGAYADLRRGNEPRQQQPAIDYRDYLRWQADTLGIDRENATVTPEGSRLADLAQWWRTELEDVDVTPILLPDAHREADADRSAGVIEVPFSGDLRNALRDHAGREATEFMAVHAVFAALLHRLNADPEVHVAHRASDIVIGTPVAGRTDPRLADLVGMFVNSVVLRTRVEPDATFADLLDVVRRGDLEALSQSDMPFEQLVATLNPPRTGRHPLFQIALTFENLPTSAAGSTVGAIDLDGVQAIPEEVDTGATRFDLELRIRGDVARFTYDTSVFSEERIAGLARRFVALAEQVVEDPTLRLDDYTVLLPDDGEVATPAGIAPRHLADIIGDAVAANPDGIAVDDGLRTLTYAQLDELSARWAHHLVDLGVGTEDVIATAIPRSIESVAAVWAVTRAGATVLPIDPQYPSDRINHMLSDSGALLGITTPGGFDDVPHHIWWLTTDALEMGAQNGASVPVSSIPRHVDSAAYIVYTSGSTGTPKGVSVTHRGLAPFASTQTHRYDVAADSRTLHFASPSFDASMLELLIAVDAAATMVIAPPTIYGGDELTEFLDEHRVSHAFITPAALAAAHPRELPHLRSLGVGGEAFGPELVERWGRGRRFLNAYGPTETTIVITMSEPLRPGGPITMGRPVDSARALVLDHRLRALPPYTPGDLYLMGPALARGYHNRAGRTATAFVAAPDGAPGARMYRTGDIVMRDLQDGLVFRGRGDNQVKVRGFRIELDEVDSVLSAHPDVDFAVTVVHGTGSEATLASYVTPAAPTGAPTDALVDASVLQAFVRDRLPRQMVPSTITVLDEIPLTGNGKLDRRALPTPQTAVADDAPNGRLPEDPAERLVARTIAAVTDRPVTEVAAEDDFFALGGTSLQATTVVSRLNVHHRGEPIRVRAVFDNPTIAALAALLDVDPETVDAEVEPTGAVVADRPRPDRIPLAPMQRRLWSIAGSGPASAEYAMPFALRLRGELDVAALRDALADVLARHTSLRTVYPATDDGPMGTILDDPYRIIGALEPQESGDVADHVLEMCAPGFDLTVDAPVRAALVRSEGHAESDDQAESDGQAESDEHTLILVVHHIAADGASLPTMVGDLMTAYRERLAGRDELWEPADLDYRDYAATMTGSDGAAATADLDRDYWTSQLAGAPAETTVPPAFDLDRLNSSGDDARGVGTTITVPVDADLRDALSRFATERSTTPFTVLHTATAVLLHRLGLGRDLVIGTPVANRSPRSGSTVDYQRVVGMFVNTLALRTVIDPSASAAELIDQVRDADLNAWDHLDAPFDDVVADLNPQRELGRHPLFQIALSVHDFTDGVAGASLPAAEGLTLDIAEVDAHAAKFDLQFTATGMHQDADAPAIALTYATDRYREHDAADLITRLLRVVRAIVDDPQRAVGDIRVTDPLEVATLSPVPGDAPAQPATFGDILAEAVAANPDGKAAVAVGEGGVEKSISYAELDARSNRLARLLIGRGIPADPTPERPETVVAMAIPRSIEALVAIWAVIKSGAAYVPVDPTYPADRIAHMLADSGAVSVLTTTAAAASIETDLPVIAIDDLAIRTRISHSSPAPISDDERFAKVSVEQLAYVIYTSGSTGTPKGVLVPHRGLAAVRDELRNRMEPRNASRVLHFASPSFDASVLEFLLAAGGASTLVIVPPTIYGGADLADFISRHKVTHAFITPAAVGSMDPATVPTLQRLAVGGEAVGAELVRQWAPGRHLLNVYGPTETTVITTHSAELDATDQVTIGAPNNGVAALVLDDRLHPVPAGVTGELYLIGDQVTRGYHNRPRLTAMRFVPAPMVTGPEYAGQRMYRTGDLVRWTPDGRLDYVGRADDQVQIRGFRVELSEIDDVIGAHPDVHVAATIVDDRSGAATLRTYVTAEGSATPDPAELRRHASGRLPRHMLPTTITVLDQLPMTPVGKLDRRALPEPEVGVGRTPAEGLERSIADVFADVLGIDAVGADDGFFDLGGNSLMATTVVSRLREQLEQEVSVQQLFVSPSPAELATALSGGTTGGPGSAGTGSSPALAPVLTLRKPPAQRNEGTPAPLFVIHPAIGLSWSFTSLLPHIAGDRAVYGLQNPSLSGAQAPATIADLAADYVARIREIAPHGPYHLLGWSLGGIVAQEVAVALQRDGHDVGQLVLLDSYVVADRPELHVAPSVRELLSEFGLDVGTEDAEPDLDEVADALHGTAGPLAELSRDDLEAVYRVFVDASPLAESWQPRTFSGDAVFVSATVDPPQGPPAVSDWIDRITGTITDVRLDSTHARMLLPENVTGFLHALDDGRGQPTRQPAGRHRQNDITITSEKEQR